jgi:hypothetical protein
MCPPHAGAHLPGAMSERVKVGGKRNIGQLNDTYMQILVHLKKIICVSF